MKYRVLLLVAALAAALLGHVAPGLITGAVPYMWSTVTVESERNLMWPAVTVDTNGDVMMSYSAGSPDALKFSVCDLSISADGKCDQVADWRIATVDSSEGGVYWYTSIAVTGDGDPMISYTDGIAEDLKVAVCDRSASANGNCDQTGDWSTLTLDSQDLVGEYTSIAIGANGDPMVSYHKNTDMDLKFAICDILASTNGTCDQAGDWKTVTVDSAGGKGTHTSIAADGDGNPMVSYYSASFWEHLMFATCDLSASLNGDCDQTDDWKTVSVDTDATYQLWSSIAVSPSGDPVISYQGASSDLRFAVCDISSSLHGNCDQTDDWNTATVDSAGDVGMHTSIVVSTGNDPMISYYDYTNGDLKFATCDLSMSSNGNCNQQGDWQTSTVDSAGNVGIATCLALDTSGRPVISYHDSKPIYFDLKFAIGAPQLTVGGIAEYPQVDASGSAPGSAARNPATLVGLAASGLLVLAAAGWYAKRRWLR